MASIASAVSGMSVVYDKEGTDPCIGYAHHGQRVHQRRRERPPPRLRGVAGKGVQQAAPSAACTDRPGRPRGRLHNRTGEACPERSRGNNANAHLKRQIMGREVVVAVTNGRLDGSTERSTEGFGRAQPRARRSLWYMGTDLVSAEWLPREFDGRRRKRVLVKIIGE